MVRVEDPAYPKLARSVVLSFGNSRSRCAGLPKYHGTAVLRLFTQAQKNGPKRNVSFAGRFVSFRRARVNSMKECRRQGGYEDTREARSAARRQNVKKVYVGW